MTMLGSLASRRRDGRSPLLLAAALVMAVPAALVAACSGQGGGASATEAAAAASRATANDARVAKPGRTRAMLLLNQAAQAAVLTSYQGEEVVTRWSNGSGSVLVSHIWHASGGPTVTQTMAAGASYLSSDTDGQAPEGVLGVTSPLVRLLENHYV